MEAYYKSKPNHRKAVCFARDSTLNFSTILAYAAATRSAFLSNTHTPSNVQSPRTRILDLDLDYRKYHKRTRGPRFGFLDPFLFVAHSLVVLVTKLSLRVSDKELLPCLLIW